MQIRFPSVKTLMSIRGVDKEKAALIRRIMLRKVRVTGNELFPVTNDWLDRCYNLPVRYELQMSAIDEVIGGFGVEGGEFCSDGFLQDGKWYVYVNMGDTYDNTVLYYNGSFRVICLGDFVERMEK